jgi:hypothetical protein
MANQEQSPKRNPGRDNKYNPHDPKISPEAQVGRDVPDESKERHTEIAVEAGEKLRPAHEEVGKAHKD